MNQDEEVLLKREDGASQLMDDLIQQADSSGVFQKLFNFLFNFCAIMLAVMCVQGLVLAMSVPDHWCHVPGRENTNMTLKQWKRLTVPTSRSPTGEVNYSKCRMFLTERKLNLRTTECQHGWEYNTTWFSRTVPSQENWVCDKKLYVTYTFVATQAAEAFGTIIFGHISDTIGRRPVFLLSLILVILGKGLSVPASTHYLYYIATVFIGHSALSSLCYAASSIGIELSSSEQRANVIMLQSLGWTLGMCLIPLVAWITKDWVSFVLLPIAPSILLLIYSYRLFPESPRWLASKGKTGRCMNTLRTIVASSGQKLPDNAEATVRKLMEQSPVKTQGPLNFLSSRTLTKNTALLIILWTLNSMSYLILLLNINNMSGNPFLNFLWQSAIEFPAGFLAKWLCDYIGRRTTNIITFIIITIVCIIIAHDYHQGDVILVIFVKLCVTIANFAVYLQATEIFPTCLRQTGLSIATLAGNTGGLIVPYIVYPVTEVHSSYPYVVLGAMALVGTVVSAFLPETLNQKLPDNMRDARTFGKDQKFWSFFTHHS